MNKIFNIPNKPAKVVRTAFILALLMIVAAVAVGFSNIDGMNGGYALIFAFVFFAMIALVVALVYRSRAREFNALVNGITALAHWTYNQNEWDNFIQTDLKESMAVNKSMLKYIAVISLVVMGFLLYKFEDVFFIWIIAGLIALLTLVAFITPRLRSAALKKGIHEAFIGEQAAYVGGQFQTWTGLGARLTGVELSTAENIAIIKIIFKIPTLQAWKEEIVRIPVPNNQMPQAKQVVALLQKLVEYER
jgi:hypothetical protein